MMSEPPAVRSMLERHFRTCARFAGDLRAAAARAESAAAADVGAELRRVPAGQRLSLSKSIPGGHDSAAGTPAQNTGHAADGVDGGLVDAPAVWGTRGAGGAHPQPRQQ